MEDETGTTTEKDEMVVVYVETETPKNGMSAILLPVSIAVTLYGGVYLWFILISTSFHPINDLEYSMIKIITMIAILIVLIFMDDPKRKMLVSKKHLQEVKE